MSKKIVVLGGGLIGSIIALELSKQFSVTIIDIDDTALSKLNRCFGIPCIQADVTDRKKLEKQIADADLVVGAVPGIIGFELIKKVIDAGKNMVDVSFFPEDPFELDERAKSKKVSVLIDCGIAPGISNMILGYHYTNMKVDRYDCVVGGLPVSREWPWEFKSIFSPIDLIDECIRPARYKENGHQVTKDAMSDPELLTIKNIGTLEAWSFDGLRTLFKTMNVPNMIIKALRYPGSIEYLKVLRESGFFSHREIEVNGVKIKPIDFATEMLKPLWELKQGEEDYSILRAKVLGSTSEESLGYEYLIFDKYDSKSGTHSMARTTGFTCSAVAKTFIEGHFDRKGLIPPEVFAAQPGVFPKIINFLEDKGVEISVKRLY